MERNQHLERLDEEDGGELADWLDRLQGTSQQCPLCLEEFTVETETELWGLRRSEGLRDEEGTAWWVYLSCPMCGFVISYDMLPR